MKLFKTLICCAGVLSITEPALADREGWYLNASFGYNTLGDENLSAVIGGISANGEAGFDGGFASGAAVGYRFGDSFSVEGEFIYRTVDLDVVRLGSIGTFSEGNFASTQFNINGYYHFSGFWNADYEPYIGAGLAYLNEIDIDLEDASGEREFEADEIAVELLGGARYQLSERAYIDAGIRYLLVGDVTMTEPGNAQNTVKTDYSPLLLTLRIGWKF